MKDLNSTLNSLTNDLEEINTERCIALISLFQVYSTKGYYVWKSGKDQFGKALKSYFLLGIIINGEDDTYITVEIPMQVAKYSIDFWNLCSFAHCRNEALAEAARFGADIGDCGLDINLKNFLKLFDLLGK